MDKEKVQHYSIRKLSVGAASVLIGLSFVGIANSNKVDASTVESNQQQVVETDKQKLDSEEQTKNTAVVDQKAQQTPVNQQSNGGGTAPLSAKNSGNENGTSQKAENTLENNQEKQNKDVENVNKNKVETNTLNLNKKATGNSIAALRESKVENQSVNDWSKIPFNSRSLDERASGTRHTRVGDTRLSEDQTKHIAISSDIKLTPDHQTDNPYSDGQIADVNCDGYVRLGLTGSTEINKNDLKKGNKVLIGTIQISNDRFAQDGVKAISTSGFPYKLSDYWRYGYYLSPVKFQNQDIGTIDYQISDPNELDIWLNVTNDANYANYATNPKISFTNLSLASLNEGNLFYGTIGNKSVYRGIKSGESLITQYDTGKHKYQMKFHNALGNVPLDSLHNVNVNPGMSSPANTDHQGNINHVFEKAFYQTDSNGNFDPNNIQLKENGELDTAIKYQSLNNNPITGVGITTTGQFDLINADGKATKITNWAYTDYVVPTKLADNLSAKEILDQTPRGKFTWSKQSDGSIIVGAKWTIDNFPKMNGISARNLSANSYLVNVYDSDKAQQIIDNNVNFYALKPYMTELVAYTKLAYDTKLLQIFSTTDVTPRDYSSFVGAVLPSSIKSDSSNTGSFNAELYRTAKVNYVDDGDHETVVNTDSITGRKNVGTDYTINIPTGYVLASNNFDGTNYRWNSSKTGLTYTFADDQAINDANPVTIHLTHGQKELVHSKVVAETIHYQYEDGSKAADDYEAKHVVLDQIGHKDLVTGKTVWDGEWSTGEFPEVASPKINGYTANPVVVAAEDVNSDTDDIVKTVIYKANDQKIFVNYVDDDNNGSTIHTDPLVGKSKTNSGYTTKDKINDYLSHGYDLVSDETNGAELKYDVDDTKDQTYSVHLKHHISDVTDPKLLTATFDRVVTEKLPSGQDKKITQHYTITRTGKQDQVTHAYTFGNWSTVNVNEDHGDKLDGYTAKIISQSTDGLAEIKDGIPTVKSETFTNANDNSTNPLNVTEAVVIGYDAKDQKAKIIFIDDTAKQELKTKDLVGKSNTKSTYDTGADVENYLDHGYELVSDDTKGNPITFDAKDAVDQSFEVHLKHKIENVKDNRILTASFDRIITEHMPDGKDKTMKQHYDIHRTATQDMVTKQYTFGDWSVANVKEDKLDNFTGYTAHLKSANPDNFIVLSNNVPTSAKAEKFTNENGKLLPQNLNEVAEIDYTANPQVATIIYTDDTTGQVLQKTTVNGHYGEAIEFTPDVSSVINGYTGKGYVLVSNSFNGQKYAADDKQNVFNVHLKHGYIDVTQSKTVTETIHYRYADGTKAADDVVVAKNFVEHGTKDLVTGAISWDGWTPASDTFAQVDSPEIAGYTPDKASIPAQKVTGDSSDLEFTVTYSKTPDPVPADDNEETPQTPVEKPVEQVEVSKQPVTRKQYRTSKKRKNFVLKAATPQKRVNLVKAKKAEKAELPKTGQKDENTLAALGLAVASVSGLFGLGLRKKKEN